MSVLDQVSIVMTTNPIPSHPKTAIIDETLASLEQHLGADVGKHVLILANGAREEQKNWLARYPEYKAALKVRWPDCKVVEFEQHAHQTEMLRKVMSDIVTPLIFWIEHDWPLASRSYNQPWPWDAICRALLDNELDDIRFSGAAPSSIDEGSWSRGKYTTTSGLDVERTVQFMGRPNIGRKEFFEKLLYAQNGTVHLEHTATRLFCESDNWQSMRIGVWPMDRVACYSNNGRAFEFKDWSGFTPHYTNDGLRMMIEQGTVLGRVIPRRFHVFQPNRVTYLAVSYDGELVENETGFWPSGYLPLAKVLSTNDRLTLSVR